ncbi:hypothetical protein BLL52_1426 [Rhodoferax antarcticus ANT.BR]|uniref:Uncharacterized protein n=1 Tax=Rhodoferax antarcticus ANT.BR TaxID=1111071 RepID=A0A1Q8YHX6_9BURK|nr:hypothetical protein BLL52_1426 [Rhodoferax antarcticus ANT.BR]
MAWLIRAAASPSGARRITPENAWPDSVKAVVGGWIMSRSSF